MNNKQSLGLISFDIAKAYDTTWRPKIMHILNKIICKGNLLNFIQNLLLERSFQVKSSNCLSDIYIQENGVPQGSSISVTLFLLAINDISKQIPKPIIPMLYADDFSIICQSSSLITIEQILQDATVELIKWSNTSGFRFSAEKTKFIIFNNKNKNKMSISMGKHTIKNDKNIKILGITFDSKCTWTPHIL